MNTIRSVLVLLSGGQDSTTCLWWAKHTYPEAQIHALTVSYGQRHAAEIGAAAEISRLAGCATHDFAHVKGLGTESALIEGSSVELRGDGGLMDQHAPAGLPTSFVPGRNMVFLALAAARAVAVGASRIVTGVCQTDYSGYPDCRKTFVNAMEYAIAEAMPSGVEHIVIDTPLMRLTKADTVAMMVGLAQTEREQGGYAAYTYAEAWKALARSVTCYNGGRPGCGKCPACVLRARGFAEAGVIDPGTVARSPSGALATLSAGLATIEQPAESVLTSPTGAALRVAASFSRPSASVRQMRSGSVGGMNASKFDGEGG